jgi:hypothetical protein
MIRNQGSRRLQVFKGVFVGSETAVSRKAPPTSVPHVIRSALEAEIHQLLSSVFELCLVSRLLLLIFDEFLWLKA